MTKLSVNINKIATLRNARGGNNPNLINAAKDCERFGAEGITVHPRPDERHIKTQDVYDLKHVVTTEFNIEGYPDRRYMELIKEIRPAQATLVPDPPEAVTSNAGWDTKRQMGFLQDIVAEIASYGVRTSIFLNPDIEMVTYAKLCGTQRIELYTEPYASMYHTHRENAIKSYVSAACEAQKIGLELNAGHDLDSKNLKFFVQKIPFIKEVSIGHALICDALYWGLENTIQIYKRQLYEK
ncbi:MAG: pyridoxine 5'-phosphate synthase [Cytophagales bacterium]|nr:pyridoxine 5'-phosphate synthase [Cytophagales bacterium]